jgi:hypothetical protein
VTRGGPLRLACQRSNVLLQIPNSPASSSGVIYSARTVAARPSAPMASADADACILVRDDDTSMCLPITYGDASYIGERLVRKNGGQIGPISPFAINALSQFKKGGLAGIVPSIEQIHGVGPNERQNGCTEMPVYLLRFQALKSWRIRVDKTCKVFVFSINFAGKARTRFLHLSKLARLFRG